MSALHQRRLGRTGLILPELGLGAMDTPGSPQRIQTITTALDLGIQLIDTARDYAGSEHLLGEVIRARGTTNLHIATKTFSRTINGAQWDVDRSLTVLGLQTITLYQLHDISTPEAWHQIMREDGALEGLRIAQYRGLIRHIGISTHNLQIARLAITSGHFDTIMLDYSAFATESAPLIDLAAQHDIGVIVMRPLGGSGRTTTMRGQIASGYTGPLTPANLLRYVLSNPAVSIAIPGARYPDRMHANVATATTYHPMDAAERRTIEQAAAAFY